MSTGKEVKAALAQAAQWGQPVALGSEHAFLLVSEKVNRTRDYQADDSAGQAFHTLGDQGAITCGGDLTLYLRYQGLETLLALALGRAADPQEAGAGLFAHALCLASDTRGLFGTLGIFKGFSVHEYPSVKLDGLSLSGEAGKPLTLVLSLICDDLNLNTQAGINTVAAFAALTQPAPGNRVLFRQGQFWINDAEGPALTASDAVAPNRFSLSLKRKLSRDYLAGGADRIAEPVGAGFPEISLSLEFPNYLSDTYLSDLGSGNHKKMRIFFGSESAGGQSLELLLPHLVITNAQAAVDKAGKIAQPVSLDCLATSQERSGMPGLLDPLSLTLTNARASRALA